MAFPGLGRLDGLDRASRAGSRWWVLGRPVIASVAGLVVAAVCAALAPPALAGTANAGLPGAPRTNPLAGMRWGIYTGAYDGIYSAYSAARGGDRRLLAKIALRPTVHWFGAWTDDSDALGAAARYISNVTGGRADSLSQIAVFRLDPWEQQGCSTLPDPASFKRWIDGFAAGIGFGRVALILQPDLPFALCSPGHSTLPLQLVAYAARRFSALPHTTVYIDVGAGDWVSVAQASWLLREAGLRQARGFAVNATHYDSTANELLFGGRVVRALAAKGVAGKHFVVNTAENGSPYLYYRYHGNQDNPAVCRFRGDRMCATLGIPPTWRVTDRRWRLQRHARSVAARSADAYLWIGRPWLDYGSYPFDLQRALALARTTPF